MVRRGSIGRGAFLALVLAAVLIPIGRSGASAPKANSLNAKTVNVSLPGPFNGCTFLDAGATPTTEAINDLIVPSAFLTTSAGNLYGENGPIASAELTSLTPETVRYTITPKEKWSNGTAFNGNDLLGWWLRAKSLRSVVSDGYRDIKTLTVSKDADVVTAVFATPYADWNLLFRDVEALGTQGNCSMAALLARPTLGPYSVTSARPNRIVLTMNKHWPVDTDRFGRIVVTDAGAIPALPSDDFVNFSFVVNRALVQAISARPNVMSHIGTSSNIDRDLLRGESSPGQAHRATRGAELVHQSSVPDRPALGCGHVLAVGRRLRAVCARPVELSRSARQRAVEPDDDHDRRAEHIAQRTR